MEAAPRMVLERPAEERQRDQLLPVHRKWPQKDQPVRSKVARRDKQVLVLVHRMPASRFLPKFFREIPILSTNS